MTHKINDLKKLSMKIWCKKWLFKKKNNIKEKPI